MRARQIVLPFRRRQTGPRASANRDLIGRSYNQDEYITVTVIDVCLEEPARVLVQRDLDGRTWSMPVWLMRLIFLQEHKLAA